MIPLRLYGESQGLLRESIILRLPRDERPAAVLTIDEILESFALLDDWEDRYSVLIDLGKSLPPFPESERTDANLVKGCVSRVWLVPKVEGDILTFDADSDAMIVKGLVALLYIIYNGKPISSLKSIEIDDIFKKLDLLQNLSPNRRNGVFAMIERIRNTGAE